MRVLFFVGTLGAGGLERFVTRISLQAKESGEFEPVVCCLSKREGLFLEKLEAANVSVYEAPSQWARSPRQLLKLRGLVRHIAPDVVHSQVNNSLLQQFFAVRAAGRIQFCVTERNCYPLRGLARLRRVAQFHTLRLLGGHYSANGKRVAEHVARMVGVPTASVQVLPNGVGMIPPDAELRAQMRAGLGWQSNDIGLGYVSRMAAHKGHAEFLRALHSLRANGLSVKACLVGDGPERSALERLAEELKLSDTVTFVGIVPNVPDYLQAFDLVALFSSREGMPNAILEAMAAGKAIIASGVGATPELLDEGRAGVVLYELTTEKLIAALTSIVLDGQRRERLAQAAARRAETLFSVEASYRRLLQHYAEVT